MKYYINPKFLVTMTKLTAFLVILLTANPIFANKVNSQSLGTTKVLFSVENATLLEIFESFEEQTSFRFLYDDYVNQMQKRFSYNHGEKTLKESLEILSKDAAFRYNVQNRSVAVSKAIEQDLQRREIRGTVTDANGLPLPGTTILLKEDNSTGTTTDIDGNFRIVVPEEGGTLIVSYIGFQTKEVVVNNQLSFSIILQEDVNVLDEVVAIGYGTVLKSKVIGAAASLKSEDINALPIGGIDESIAGRIAGVQIVTPGAPGASSQIKIRSIGTITAGANPLIVVDGYPMTEGSDLNAINPNDIESIDVLKDAASTAIYGSRGANGVIFVTTKSAKYDKTTFNFNAYSGFQRVLNPLKFLNAYQFAQLVKEARDWGYVSDDPTNRAESDGTATRLGKGARPRNLIPSNFDVYLAGTPGLTNNDWLEDIFQSGEIRNYNISVSGKNAKTNWFVSGGYFNQEGIIIGSHFERFTAKVNLKTKFNDNIIFGINLTPSITEQRSVVEGWTDSPLQQAILSEPFFTPFNDEGTLNISQQIRWHNNGGTDGALVENPVAIAQQRQDERNKFRLFGSAFLEADIFKNLTFKTLLGGDYDYSIREQFRPSTIGAYRRDVSAAVPSASERTRVRKNWITENTLTYTNSFDDHSLNVLAAYSYQKERRDEMNVSASELESNDIKNIAGAAETTSNKYIREWILISYFGRIQYDYAAKYLLNATIRRDGSSRFGDNVKFGIFPSVSVGWVVNKENFFNEDSFFNSLKLRYSWGKSGNNQIGDYGSIAVLRQLNGILGDKFISGQRPSTAPNANLSWETSVTNNFGLDLGFFNNQLNLSADYFIAKTEDMLLNVPVPLQSGFSTSLQNIGSMENKGFELVLSTSNINLGKVQWSSSLNFSKAKNTVTALAKGQDQIIAGGTNITRVGHSIGDFYGYIVDGIYKSQAEIDASVQKGTDVKVGDWRIVNVDGNNAIDDNDRTTIGSALPDFTYGFNNRFAYNNFDFNVFIDGVEGNHVLSRTVRNATNGQGFSNQLLWYYENRWHPENNPNGTLARPDYTQSSERLRANVSSVFLQDGSFLRIRNITLGYTLPTETVSKIGLQKLRVYATAKDPFLFTKFKGYNPEQSRSNPLDPSDTEGSYPQNKSFVLGLNVSF